MVGKQMICLLSVAANAAASGAISSVGVVCLGTSCSFTFYNNLCFNSLARYASAVQQDPIQLARAAANVSLAGIRAVPEHVNSIRVAEQRTMAEVRDCCGVLREAMDRTCGVAMELAALGEEAAIRVGNAQRWMSAALTNKKSVRMCFTRWWPEVQRKVTESCSLTNMI